MAAAARGHWLVTCQPPNNAPAAIGGWVLSLGPGRRMETRQSAARAISLVVGVARQGEVMGLKEVDEDVELQDVKLLVDDLLHPEEKGMLAYHRWLLWFRHHTSDLRRYEIRMHGSGHHHVAGQVRTSG
jgi:hypothetical protein